MNKNKSNIIIVSIIIFSLIITFFIGKKLEDGNVLSQIQGKFPDMKSISLIEEGLYSFLENNLKRRYISTAEGNGYGGPVKVAIICDTIGSIVNVSILESKDTKAFFQKVENSEFISVFTGKRCGEYLTIGNNIDAVTGATLTSRGIVTAVNTAGRKIAKDVFGKELEPLPDSLFVFGLREIFIMLLFGYWLIIHKYLGKFKQHSRFLFLFLSIVTLGFIYVVPLSLININSFILGYFPDFHQNFYFYLLFAGVFLPVIFLKKSVYCGGVCPFGAVQEYLGKIGGAKQRIPVKIHNMLILLPSILGFLLIISALLFRKPASYSYEIFGTLFNITGTLIQFILLVLVIILSLFLSRPWCNYLCPVKAVVDFVKKVRILIYK